MQSFEYFCIRFLNKYTIMKVKNNRLEALRLIISSQQLGSQDELLNALQKEGFKLTQATLSRDLKQLKVAKAATMGGNYIYVLPNDTMYKRVSTPSNIREMMQVPGFVSINFSGNMGVIKTRPAMPAASPGTSTIVMCPRSSAPSLATTRYSSSSRRVSDTRKSSRL